MRKLLAVVAITTAIFIAGCNNHDTELPNIDNTADKTALISAISAADTLMDSKTVGTAVGNVPQSAKDTFTAAIDAAQSVADNTPATQTEVDDAVTALAAATDAFNAAIIQTVADTRFNNKMVFDCQRRYDSVAHQFTASGLAPPYDADLNNDFIPELTEGDPAYLSGAYITLDIGTAVDGDTITNAALVLKNSADTYVRTISADGTIQYLGPEGFIYISSHGDYGYFFASSEHEFDDSVTYTVGIETVTRLSELTTTW